MKELLAQDLPEALQGHLSLAKEGYEEGYYTYAKEICLSILKSHPSCVDARRLLHQCIQNLSPEKSRRIGIPFMVARSLSCVVRRYMRRPRNLVVLRNYAKIAQKMGMRQTEALILEEMYRLKETAGHGLSLGHKYIELGDFDKAYEHAELLQERYPADAKVRLLLQRASVAKTMSHPEYRA